MRLCTKMEETQKTDFWKKKMMKTIDIQGSSNCSSELLREMLLAITVEPRAYSCSTVPMIKRLKIKELKSL